MNTQICNSARATTLATDASLADTFLARLTGLLNRKTLKEGDALIITRCNSIHTFFMRFTIDIVYLRENKVIKTVSHIKPFKFSFCPGADKVIELPSGTIVKTKTQVGDKIEFKS